MRGVTGAAGREPQVCVVHEEVRLWKGGSSCRKERSRFSEPELWPLRILPVTFGTRVGGRGRKKGGGERERETSM